MPRWASRLTLRITDVRVQRVQDITKEDCAAEGLAPDDFGGFCDLWGSLHKDEESWHSNPWVWAITFEVLRANVDAVLASGATG